MSSSTTGAFDLLIFDWDGTIFDSIGIIVACTQASLRDLGMDGRISEETIRSTVGLGLRETMQALLPGAGEAEHQRLREAYFLQWPSYRDRPRLFDGARETLNELDGAGHFLSVATGKSRRGLDRDLERTGMGPLFAATKTVDEAPSKPHPQMVLDLLNELGIKASRALMVGDTTYDLEMARSAGVASLGVLSGSHSRDQLEACSPLACLGSVAELASWLRELSLREVTAVCSRAPDP